MNHVAEVSAPKRRFGSIAQLGEHMPYKHGVGGSSPSFRRHIERHMLNL